MAKLINNKALFLGLLGILIVAVLSVKSVINTVQPEIKIEEQKSPEPKISNEEDEEFDRLCIEQTAKRQIFEDLDGDNVKELIELSLTGNCASTYYQIFIYKKVTDDKDKNDFYYELLANTEVIEEGSWIASTTKIEAISFGKDNLMLLDGLYKGVNSGFSAFYRFDDDSNKISIVCRNGPDIDKCKNGENHYGYFFNQGIRVDVIDLEKDGNPEIIELDRIYPATSTDEKMDSKTYIMSISRYDSESKMFEAVSDAEFERLSKIIIDNSPDYRIYSLQEYNDTREDERNKIGQ